MGSFVPFGGFFSSPSDQHQGALSPWLQMAELGVNPCPRGSVSQEQAMNTLDNLKAKGSTRLRSDTMVGSQRKRDNLCQCHHHNQPSFEPEIRGKCFELPTAVGFHHLENKAKNFNDGSNFTGNSSCKECDHGKITPCKSMDLQKHSTSQSSNPVFRSSKTDRPHSPSSGVSVTTDLGLELFSQPCKQQKKANPVIECSNHAFFDLADENNFKTLYKALFGRLGRQCEAVRTISQIVSHSWKSNAMNQTSPLRGDIWLNFIGPDILGKRKIASTLAEILYGSKNNLIHVDLCYDCGEKVFGHREKTIVDHIAEELHKTPRCVVFLENVHSADLLAQRSLLKAFRSGRFSDSHGREVTVDNRIFVLTSKKPFSEERIARSIGWPLQIVVKDCEKFHNQMISNKRKLSGKAQTSRMSLDLNLPAETSEPHEPESESWLEEFSGQVDKTLVKVVFDPFDYDTLAMRVSKLVHESFREVFGSNFLLEVEPSVIDQMVAAVCLSEREKEVEDWIERVLSKGFVEAQKRYQFTDHSIVVISVCQALFMEEKVSQPCLPSKIILT